MCPQQSPPDLRGRHHPWEREVWGVGTHVRRCPRFLFSLMLPEDSIGGGGCEGHIRFPRFERSPSRFHWQWPRVALRILLLLLGEQFRTPSLESVTIHTVRPFLVGWLVGSLMKMSGSPPAMRKWPLKVSESSEEDANYVYAGSFAGCVVWQQGLLLHALKFLLLDLLLFGDKLLRNSGQLFKSKSTSLGVL